MSFKVYLNLFRILDMHTGMARYADEIIKRMVAGHAETEWFGATELNRSTIRNISELKRFDFDTKVLKLWSEYSYNPLTPRFPSYDFFLGRSADVYVFWANFTPYLPIKGKVITVLHDLNPLYAYKGARLKKYKKKTAHVISRSDRIITVSGYSKNDICEKYDVPPEKISVIYNAVDIERFSEEADGERKRKVREKYHLPEKYFLYLGSTMKNKNIPGILDAISLLPDDIRGEWKFVCSNTEDYLVEHARIKGVSDSVIFLNGVDEEDKVALYQMARFTLFVSFHEGFGLPIVESQASGTPVITSNVSCLPEIAGEDSALLTDPHDPASIADAITKLITDDQLLDDLKQKGMRNIKRFSWDRSAAAFYEVIDEVYKSGDKR